MLIKSSLSVTQINSSDASQGKVNKLYRRPRRTVAPWIPDELNNGPLHGILSKILHAVALIMRFQTFDVTHIFWAHLACVHTHVSENSSSVLI